MKKTFGSIILLSLIIVLSGCSSNNSSEQAVDNNPGRSIKSSKEDCVDGCKTLWKSNQSNVGKSDDDMMKDCNSLCDAGQGMQNNDVDSCAKSEGILRDTCYGDVAKNTNNPALCEKIISKLFISSCYIDIAEKTKDKTLCDKVTDKIMKEICLEKIIK
ncbi:MAG: hypothetical protein WCJ57_02480 [Candidatus Falkowbacteria bacterium]